MREAFLHGYVLKKLFLRRGFFGRGGLRFGQLCHTERSIAVNLLPLVALFGFYNTDPRSHLDRLPGGFVGKIIFHLVGDDCGVAVGGNLDHELMDFEIDLVHGIEVALIPLLDRIVSDQAFACGGRNQHDIGVMRPDFSDGVDVFGVPDLSVFHLGGGELLLYLGDCCGIDDRRSGRIFRSLGLLLAAEYQNERRYHGKNN